MLNKKITKNLNKIFGVISLWIIAFSSWFSFAQSTTFSERLNEIWMNVSTFSNKKSISRYEVARLLNAANCEDCVQAPLWMQQTYDQNFWNWFKAIDGKDFNDINYWAAIWNKKSYYYCVAYVWDNGFMAWYPSTSTKCQWNFCGQDAITLAEVYQTVLNIIQPQIMQKYSINRSNVKSRQKSLKKNSTQMKVLNQRDIDIINNADKKVWTAQSNEEFQAWLKYCMYNLSACGFESFGKIWTWYWPVSELNILYKEWIISREDAESVATSTSMNWADAVRIFWAVFDAFSSCSFNVDYDCDGITNWDDNCPNVFNPNQYDLDGDGKWNVCDDDIDGDGQKNPIWIVDDGNNIIISQRDDELDQTPLWDKDAWFWFFINVESIGSKSPVSVVFAPLTDWNIKTIERDFWDGNKQISNWTSKVWHTFTKSATYNVKATASDKSWAKSFAMTKIFISSPESENYMLNIHPSFSFKNGKVDYTFTPIYSGSLDYIMRSVNGSQTQSLKSHEKYTVSVVDEWIYVIEAKWYKAWNMKSVAAFTFRHKWSPSFATISVKPWYLWEKTAVATNVVWMTKNDIDHVSIWWWQETTDSQGFSQEYIYEQWWVKLIEHNLILKDGSRLTNLATITVENQLLTQSYALNVSWSPLSYKQSDRLSLWLSMYPQSRVMSLFSRYQGGVNQFLFSPDISQVKLNFMSATAWNNTLINSVNVNRCISIANQGTVHVNAVDVCDLARREWTLSKYKCDMDKDWIPDICDDDIDGDGVKNLLWLIVKENKDCSISPDNINVEILRKEFWVCSLDNCPFDWNEDQVDMNNNWIWDVCESSTLNLWWEKDIYATEEWNISVGIRDSDKDWIPDNMDACVDVPWNSSDGCPVFNNQYCWSYSLCGNGKIDDGETCQNCPYDVGSCCGNGKVDKWETCWTCPKDAWKCDKCWNGKIDEWENCKNCPDDVGECTAFCWNGKIEEAETCQNCPEDVKVCDKCWNGQIDDGENCKNCPKDVRECSAICGNGKIEKWETCENCPKDVKWCKSQTCWDGKLDKESWEECDNWETNGKDEKCTLTCTIYDSNKPLCGNWLIDEWEDCNTCPDDLGELCIDDWDDNKCWNGQIDDGETCENCPKDVKDGCVDDWDDNKCWNWIQDLWEDCGNCPWDVSECNKCWNGQIDEWEDCNTCPEDAGWCINTAECNSCPCNYSDFSNAFSKWDSVRAMLWDKSEKVFYRFSNVVAVENFLYRK